jgi:hypothetical protein
VCSNIEGHLNPGENGFRFTAETVASNIAKCATHTDTLPVSVIPSIRSRCVGRGAADAEVDHTVLLGIGEPSIISYQRGRDSDLSPCPFSKQCL